MFSMIGDLTFTFRSKSWLSPEETMRHKIFIMLSNFLQTSSQILKKCLDKFKMMVVGLRI